MSTRKQERAAEVARIRAHIPHCLHAIEQLVAGVPDDLHLGTLRSLDNTVTRAFVDVRDAIKRERARRGELDGEGADDGHGQ